MMENWFSMPPLTTSVSPHEIACVYCYYIILNSIILPDISASAQDPFGADDVVFPVDKDEFTLEPVFDEPLANIKIPGRLLETRANESSKHYDSVKSLRAVCHCNSFHRFIQSVCCQYGD